MSSQDLGSVLVDTAAAVVLAANQPMTRKSRIQEIKAETWTRYSWDVMLAAAPIALELLGSCQLVACSPRAEGLELREPKRGFQYLRGYKFLVTALREVASQGREAFESGRENMNEIRENAERTRDCILNIFDYLKHTDTDAELYEIQLSNLEETSNTCKDCAAKMHTDFANWLHFVSELHVACQDTSSQAEADFRTFESKEKANDIILKQQEKMVSKSEETMKTFEKQMTEQTEKYKDLMNKYPTGNDFLKQQLTMLAADTAAQIITIGVTAAACSASPMAALGLAGKAAGDIKDSVKSSQTNGTSSSTNTDSATTTGESAAVVDPALTRCEPVKNAVTQLKQLLKSGPAGAVDWDFIVGGSGAAKDGTAKKTDMTATADSADKKTESAAAADGATSADKATTSEAIPPPKKTDDAKFDKDKHVNGTTKTSSSSTNEHQLPLETIGILLQTEKDGMEGSSEEKESAVGKQLLVVLSNVLTQYKAIKAEVANASSTTWKQPAQDSAVVKEWISKIETAATTLVKLSAQSTSRAGVANGRVPIVITDPAAKDKVKARSDLNKDTLDAARSQLEISQKGLANTQEMFFKSSNKVMEVQEKLDKIRADIARLSDDKATLSAVRDVLRSCIAFLGDLMDKIGELVRFFSTISILVRSAVNNAVKPYRKTVALASKQLSGGIPYLSIAMCNTINQYTMAIAASFSLYEDIGLLYITIHDKHLVEGITMVNAMANKDGRSTHEKQAEINKYSKKAALGIKDEVKKTGDKIISGVNDRLAQLENLLKPLPPLANETRKAIEAGSAVVQKERIKEVESKNPGVEYIALPSQERKQAAEALARSVDPDDLY